MKRFVSKGVAMLVLAVLAVGCDDGNGQSELAAGKAAYEVSDFKKALRCFEKSVKQDASADALVWLARTRLGMGELSAAKDALDRAAALDGQASDIRLLQAQVAWHAKDYARATKGFASVAKDPALDAETQSQGWAGIGIVEMTENNNHAARIAFLRAIRCDRKNPAAWYHLGLLYRDGFGYPEAALEQFDFYVHLNQVADSRVQKVQRVFIPELKDTIARAAASRPGVSGRNSSACAVALARADETFRKGQLKTARLAYQDALKADPLSYPAALGLAKAWERTDATVAGQQKTLECYRVACMLRPSAVSTFLSAGSLALKIGAGAQAVEIYSRAVAADPGNVAALDGLVRAFRKTGTKANLRLAADYDAYRQSLAKKRK